MPIHRWQFGNLLAGRVEEESGREHGDVNEEWPGFGMEAGFEKYNAATTWVIPSIRGYHTILRGTSREIQPKESSVNWPLHDIS